MALLAPVAMAQDDTTVVSVYRVRIKGVKSIPLQQVKDSIVTEIPIFFAFWFTKPPLEEEALEQDMLRIQNLYALHGFYNAKSTFELDFNKARDRVNVFIRVEEGKPITLRSINIQYTVELAPRILKQIGKSFPLKVQRRFSSIKYQTAKNYVSLVLANNGYPRAEVEGEALVNQRERWADVTLHVASNEKYVFGFTRVVGNKKVRSGVITREGDYQKGDTYSEKELEDTQTRIFALGLFRYVLIDKIFDPETNSVDVSINVKERKLGTFKVGLGFGTEDLFRAQLSWTQKNFLGNGRTLSVSSKFSSLIQGIEGKFTQPYFLGTGSELFLSTNTRRDDVPSYTALSQIATVGVTKRFLSRYEAFGQYAYQITDITDISAATSEFIVDTDYHLFTIGGGIRRDSVGATFNPRRGSVMSAAVDLASNYLGSEVSYVKTTFTARKFHRVFKTVLAGRLDVGVIQPIGKTTRLDVPIFKRFFAGGSTTNRGFAFQKLGPLDSNEEPVGGNSLILGTIESRFPVWRELGGVLFVDVGNVYARQWQFKLDELKYSPGIGIRYDTLIGPLRVDFGWNANGDEDLRPFQVHFSIGHTF